MNCWTAAIGAAGTAGAFWAFGARAARHRRLSIGALPLALLPLTAGGAGLAAHFGAQPPEIGVLGGVAVAGWIDARTGFIFDPIAAALLAGSLGLCVFAGSVPQALAGAIAVGATLFLVHALTGGRGIGLGDVKLGTAVAAALGVASGSIALGSAFVIGATYGILLLATKRAHLGSRIRFAPFIAAGTFVSVLLPWTHGR
jgi:leader peptidase (prepilin peptidase)/N-methyltransferase